MAYYYTTSLRPSRRESTLTVRVIGTNMAEMVFVPAPCFEYPIFASILPTGAQDFDVIYIEGFFRGHRLPILGETIEIGAAEEKMVITEVVHTRYGNITFTLEWEDSAATQSHADLLLQDIKDCQNNDEPRNGFFPTIATADC